MAKPKKKEEQIAAVASPDPNWLELLNSAAPLNGVPGPGRWLVTEYQPTSLFSLKTSQATSSVGVSLIVPTPYAIKMALVDAAFRTGLVYQDCEGLLQALVKVEVRIAPARAAVVTNTFLKIRQESRVGDPLRPYIPSIAYRELVYLDGTWLWAFDLAACDNLAAARIVRLAPHVNYVGKRGSFIQFIKTSRLADLDTRFTKPLRGESPQVFPAGVHVRQLDDFGPEASLEILSSFTSAKPKRDRHRKFVETVVPAGLINTGPGFSEYRRAEYGEP
jgi:hypothetical protein